MRARDITNIIIRVRRGMASALLRAVPPALCACILILAAGCGAGKGQEAGSGSSAEVGTESGLGAEPGAGSAASGGEKSPSEAGESAEAGAGIPEGFVRGVDVSSYLAERESGARFYDFDGNELDDEGFFSFLSDCGINYVRVRVWNDPFDADGNGYGGGDCDIENAVRIGQLATGAGCRLLVDFHYSDFWADPKKQKPPKAWEGLSLEEKASELERFTKDSLIRLLDAGVDVGMAQVGNETNGSLCGETEWDGVCALLAAGSSGIHAASEERKQEIAVVCHFANPETEGRFAEYAMELSRHGVEYDIFATSYYPYWHGTIENLAEVLREVSEEYGKHVMVAETSWAYTLEDGDGHPNTIAEGADADFDYPISPQGQAQEIRAVMGAVAGLGEAGVGVFYWEPAWIPAQPYDPSLEGAAETLEANREIWEEKGSGWASSYAAEYDPDDAGKWHGGSAVDNQALFDFSGHPLESLRVFLEMEG